jgi:Ca-activated chloride channel family protein
MLCAMMRTGLFLLLLSGSTLLAQGLPGGEALGPEDRPLPLRGTSVHAEVAGPVARVTVRQEFLNSFDHPIEVLYRFPLPDQAAVAALQIEIGSRLVTSELTSMEEARRRYARAKREGETAALTTQSRANVFTQRLANVLPGEWIHVELVYLEDLRFRDGGYEFVFPVVVASRYAATRDVATRHLPAGEQPDHLLDLEVEVDSGTPLGAISSDSHGIQVRQHDSHRALVTLSPYDRLPVKDFVLHIGLAADGPVAAVLAHRTSGAGVFSLLVHPGAATDPDLMPSRELVFVLDCSGSMDGMPIETAKKVVSRSLDTLGPDDTFRILRFSDQASAFDRGSLVATPANLQRARRYLEGLTAGGGTEVLSGVRLALDGQADHLRVRIIHFLTDGQVGNETEILAELSKNLGDTRLFPLGVGSSVNRFLLERMAQVGRGEVSYIRQGAPADRIEEEVIRFATRTTSPVLTHLEIDWNGLPVMDHVPERLPDLFSGRPVTITGRYFAGAEGEIVLRGWRGDQPFEQRIPVVLPESERMNSALPALWARTRIRELLLARWVDPEHDVTAEVTRLALDYGILSPYTAFVATDGRVVADPAKSRTIVQPLPAPEGVGGEGFYGILAAPPTARTAPPPKTAAPPADPKPKGPTDTRALFPPIDEIPDLHLAFLRTFQEEDGRWSDSGDLFGDVGATSLALLAFRASGQTPEVGRYAESVKQGIRWLEKAMARGTASEARRAEPAPAGVDEASPLLARTLATIAFVEYAQATGKGPEVRAARAAAEDLAGQAGPDGGFARAGGKGPSDTVTTSLAILALWRAREAGFPVPDAVIREALAFLDQLTNRDTGEVAYSKVTVGTGVDGLAIAASLLARMEAGIQPMKVEQLRESMADLLNLPVLPAERWDPFYLFLATSAFRRAGPEVFEEWNVPLDKASRQAMIPMDAVDEDGAPVLTGPMGGRLSRAPAMALFGLTRTLYPPGGRPFTLD